MTTGRINQVTIVSFEREEAPLFKRSAFENPTHPNPDQNGVDLI